MSLFGFATGVYKKKETVQLMGGRKVLNLNHQEIHELNK